MTCIKINGKDIALHFGPLMAEWLWMDTLQGEVTSAASDWIPATIFYAHKNYCRIDGKPISVTKGEVFKWFENAKPEDYVNALNEYEDSKARERWEKLQAELNEALTDAQKKMSGEISGGIVTE